MIVETDFADHWKTDALVKKCGAEAVRCLLRLWSFCQLRKTDEIKSGTPAMVEAIAKWNGPSGELFNALKELHFIDTYEGEERITMHDFSSVNLKMCAVWKNGRSGGRPPNPRKNKDGEENQSETNPKPNGNQNPESEEPNENQTETNPKPNGNKKKERQKERIKKNNTPQPPAGDSACVRNFAERLEELSVPESIVERQMLVDQYALWVSYRRETKKKPLQPQTSLLHANKVAKCIDTDGLSAAQVERLFENAMEREWEGWYFESEVIKLKAEGMPVKNKKTPPRDLGSIGIPAGALGFEGGVL